MRISVYVVVFLIFVTNVYSQEKEVTRKAINQEILQTVQQTLGETVLPDKSLLTGQMKDKFVQYFKQELDKKQRMSSEEQKEAILKRIPGFLSSRIGDPYIQGTQEEKWKGFSLDLAHGISIALSREHPVPVEKDMKAMQAQYANLVQEATRIVHKQLPDVSEKQVTYVANFIFGRIIRKMNDPFSNRGKRLLSEDEIHGIIEKWNEPSMLPPVPVPFQIEVLDPKSKSILERDQISHIVGLLYRVWVKLY
jgi:hypothetical protein